MRESFRWGAWILLCLMLLLAGCDEVTPQTPAPSTGEEQAELRVPTRTLGPIVSFTPRFTATPIPSLTFTPSDTPEPTDTSVPPTSTPTITPSPTATASGVIRSTSNVNLREGPGETYPIVMSVAPGTELGVLGMQTDARGREWYKVALTDEDGEVRYLWVFASLVNTDFDAVTSPVATPSTPQARRATPTPEPNRVNILAYCRQKDLVPPRPTTNDNVYIEWSWFVARPEYMDDHLAHANYEVRLDGKLLSNWAQYATDSRLESGVWIVYWYYPVGRLSAGEHKVDFRLTWDAPITDGYEQFGPGTRNETDTGDCTFTVRAP